MSLSSPSFSHALYIYSLKLPQDRPPLHYCTLLVDMEGNLPVSSYLSFPVELALVA